MSISEIKKENAVAEKDITLYLSDFWRGFLKFWWIGVLMGLLLGSVSFYKSYIQYVPVYKSSATFTVHMENDTLTGDGGMSAYSFFYDRTTADQLAIVFPYVMDSNILQERVCRDMNVSVMPASVSVSCVAGHLRCAAVGHRQLFLCNRVYHRADAVECDSFSGAADHAD